MCARTADQLTASEEVMIGELDGIANSKVAYKNSSGVWEGQDLGTGNVSKVGTPVNNQVGVWTGDGTLEGDAALTFDTTTDTLATTNVVANTKGGNNTTVTVGGTADAITLTPTTAITDYASNIGMQFTFVAGGTNTITPPTIAISGLASLNTTMGLVALPIGGILTGNIYTAYIESATSIRVAPFDAVSVNGDTMNGTLSVTFTSTNPTAIVNAVTSTVTAEATSVVNTKRVRTGVFNATIGGGNTQNWTNTNGGLTGKETTLGFASGATGAVTTMVGDLLQYSGSASGASVTNLIMQRNTVLSATSPITNLISNQIAGLGLATNSTGITLSTSATPTVPSGHFGVYDETGYANYFSGTIGIGQTTPTAYLHLKAGTASANTAPLKLTAGTVNTTPEAGAIEFDGTNYFMTI